MSSHNSSPYKSRLFNFLNRQYLKLNSSVGIKVRQLGQAINTGVATIIYPFYLLLQTSQKIGNILQPKSSQTVSNTAILPDCDQIIEDVAKEVIKYPQITQLNLKKIQGLASILATKEIVLVRKNKQIIKVFSTSQQCEIKAIIRNARGNYWHKKRLLTLQSLSSESSQRILPFVNLPNFILFFTEKRKIRKNLNNQNQSSLTNPVKLTENTQRINTNKSNQLITILDSFLAKLELISVNNTLSKQSTFSHNLTDNEDKKRAILVIIQSAIAYFFGFNKKKDNLNQAKQDNYLKSQDNNSLNPAPSTAKLLIIADKIRERIVKILPILQTQTKKLIIKGNKKIESLAKGKIDNLVEDDPYQIKYLIWLAIDYFFKIKSPTKTKIIFTTQEKELFLIDGENSEPWLSWQDLYGEESLTLPESNPVNTTINNSINYSTVEGAGIVINREKMGETNVTNSPQEKPQIIVNKKQLSKEEANLIINDQVANNKPVSQELEAKVISVEYEKHLLEIILEKLDQIIAWLENILLKIINWWQKQKKKFS